MSTNIEMPNVEAKVVKTRGPYKYTALTKRLHRDLDIFILKFPEHAKALCIAKSLIPQAPIKRRGKAKKW